MCLKTSFEKEEKLAESDFLMNLGLTLRREVAKTAKVAGKKRKEKFNKGHKHTSIPFEHPVARWRQR